MDFLTEYECTAAQAMDVLEAYANEDWLALKKELLSLYTSSEEKRTYQPKDIQHYSMKKRKIMKLLHFDNY